MTPTDGPSTADQLLLDDHLPALPGVAIQLLRLCDDPDAGAGDVAEVVRMDPSLVARVLQVVNSPYYPRRAPVVRIERAAAVLGLRSVKLIGLGLAVMGALWGDDAREGPHASIIGASAVAASAARAFAARIGVREQEEAFAAGLLCFVGELSLAQTSPDAFSRLWAEAGGLPGPQVQRRLLGTDGTRRGEQLHWRWGLPELLRAGVTTRTQAVVERCRQEDDPFVAAVGFGTALADSLLSPGHDLTRVRVVGQRWGIDDDDLGCYLAEFRDAVSSTYRMLGVAGSAQVDGLLRTARRELLQSTLFLSLELDDASREIDVLRAENRRLADRVLLDPLTDLPNRAAFDAFLAAHVNDHVRRDHGRRVGVVMLDLDRFKSINDTLGHPIGDLALCSVAAVVRSEIRADELFARLGGDEFALVVPDATLHELQAAGERIRRLIEEGSEVPGLGHALTASVGVALLDHTTGESEVDAKRLVAAADDALYAAKRRGGNLCVLAG